MQGNDKFRLELNQRGMKPSELAKSIGMDRRKVRGVLRGSEEIRLIDVARVAKALGFNVNLVFDPLIAKRRVKRARIQWV